MPVELARRRSKVLVIAIILVVAALAAVLVSRSEPCAGESVLHPPAGTCINPRALVVTGPFEDVSSAVSEFEGRILFSSGSDHLVRVPAVDLDELDRTKDALVAAGFEVRYALVGQLDS